MKNKEFTTKISISAIEECNNETKNLIKKAQEATQRAYAPYSRYQVGAAVLLSNGEIITGNNQENASYPAGICAERTALSYANATYPGIPIIAIAIAAYHNGSFTQDVCSPCGICRQYLIEVENRYNNAIKVIMCSGNEVYEVTSAKALLPLSFDKKNLEG